MDNSAFLMRGTRKPSPSFFFLLLLPLSLSFFFNFLGYVIYILGFPGGEVVKNMPANAGGTGNGGSVPGSGRYPGEGNGKPLQYSCLENPMDRGAWRSTVHGVSESDTTELTCNEKEGIHIPYSSPIYRVQFRIFYIHKVVHSETVNFRMFLLPSKQPNTS